RAAQRPPVRRSGTLPRGAARALRGADREGCSRGRLRLAPAPPTAYATVAPVFRAFSSMQPLVWILRFLIVVLLVWFAVKHGQEVELFGVPGQSWKAPLVFVLLVVFVAGIVIGLLAWIPTVVRQR